MRSFDLIFILCIPYLTAAQERAFRFEGPPSAPETEPSNSSLVWQPLRATFRPLNRQSPPTAAPDSAAPTEPVPASSTVPSLIEASENVEDDDERPTRVPLSRFRPTRAPSVDAPGQPPASSPFAAGLASGSQQQAPDNSTSSVLSRLTRDCFECICEAATSCNANSRCKTSDVRNTRCGLFLISYDQWLESGLSRELVTPEALAADAAADERAFYRCVTERDCSERLLTIYLQRNARDCDKDGRIDCYDLAAVHQSSAERCAGEELLESQYWSDFNACFGFGR